MAAINRRYIVFFIQNTIWREAESQQLNKRRKWTHPTLPSVPLFSPNRQKASLALYINYLLSSCNYHNCRRIGDTENREHPQYSGWIVEFILGLNAIYRNEYSIASSLHWSYLKLNLLDYNLYSKIISCLCIGYQVFSSLWR